MDSCHSRIHFCCYVVSWRNHCSFFPVDTVCCWAGLCHWTGEDIPILLSKAQDKGNQFLPGRSVCGTAWLAYCWSCSGTLWLFPPVQVRANMEEPISTKTDNQNSASS